MFIELLLYFTQSKKEICICNNDCTSLCPAIYYNTSSNSSFHDFIIPHVENEKEIDLYLYTQRKEFTFFIDLSYFHNRKLTMKALADSKDILLHIKKESEDNYTETQIKPGYKIILPELKMIPDNHINIKKFLSSTNSPISTTIPISLGLHQLNHEGSAKCENGPTSKTDRKKEYELSSLKPSTDSNCGCPNNADDLDKPLAYQCGHRCYGAVTYTHTFKGVQFAIYGTKDISNVSCYVKIDDNPEEEVSLYYYLDESHKRLDYTIIYTSEVLKYDYHTVKIYPKDGKKYEINKFAYWPSLTAKRLNCTDFVLNKDGNQDNKKWKTETDGIGGIRKYRNNGGMAIIKLRCTKFWIYGLYDKDYPDLNVYYNGKSDSNKTSSPDGSRRENVLIYESPEFEYSSIVVNLKPKSGVLIIYSIFYEVPPSPVETPIPISVSLQEMECQNIDNCANYTHNSNVGYESNDLGCSLDYEKPEAYQCGLRCWGTRMSVSYTFKGVKFGIFGKYDPDFSTVNVDLDGKNIVNINANGPALLYSNLFESDVYVYKDHTVTISSSGLYEIYKLVFWPTMKANRCNATELSYSPYGVHTSSDRMGGLYCWYDYYPFSPKVYRKNDFKCSRFWIYMVKDTTYGNAELSFDGKTYTVSQVSAKKDYYGLLFDSDELDYKSIDLVGTSKGYLNIYCIYYHDEQPEFEYIDKNFHITLPYIQIHVTPKSRINQISGCNFSHISENLDYFIKLEKDVLFYDNTFEYSNSDNIKYAQPIKILYNSQGTNFLSIKNCTFIQASRKTNYNNANVFYCSENYSINVEFQSCLFDNCGVSSSEIIIQIESQNSFIKMDNCTFQFTQNSCKSIEVACSRVSINECKFIKSGPIIIEHKTDDPSSTAQSNNIAITRCSFDSCSISDYRIKCIEINIQTTSSITFEYNVISNMNTIEATDYTIFINGNNKIDQIDFKNTTFINNTCQSLYGGGSGINLHNINKILFNGCIFINNEARKNVNQVRNNDVNMPGEFYYNGDGGALQIGFFCLSNKAALVFEECIFKKNRAVRHGGALAIQTLSTVEINNCLFESNEANYDFGSSAELLQVENHFHKKSQGRAGAIYINPTYFYNAQYLGCENIDDYLKKITITNSQFVDNSAYDGYAIYIEGDEVPTEFVINTNIFNGNYNYDEASVNNDPNITSRGVITTEIHNVSELIKSQNEFLNSRAKKLIFVDHYGSRISTKEFTSSRQFSGSYAFTRSNDFTVSVLFTKSNVFTETGDFSRSGMFTNSQIFHDSGVFTKSLAFTNSERFSGTSVFTKTEGFTETKAFSTSEKFTNTRAFSDSQKFSYSGFFSNTEKFSLTCAFTKTTEFSYSISFTESERFSTSHIFTNTEKFTSTDLFSNTNKFTTSTSFSNSNKFSESKPFSESFYFSQSRGFSSSIPFISKAQCALYIDDEYKVINNCVYSQFEGKNILIKVITTNFTDYQKDGDGSAIHLTNCGFLANRTHFIDCVSTSTVGAGGAIYINNSMSIENNVTFIDTLFLRCKAAYGGAVFLYSSSDISINHFLRCQFLSNEAYAKKSVSNENKNLFGGSSIYASTKGLFVENCTFHRNKGSSLKIYNLFDGEKSKSLLEKVENSFSIIGCDFEKDEKSENSIAYVDDSFGNKIEIMNCNFKGKLKKGSHYINGILHEKENVHVKSCNFEDDANDAINLELITDNFAFELNSKKVLNPISKFFMTIMFGTVILIVLLSLITLKINAYKNIDYSNEKALEP